MQQLTCPILPPQNRTTSHTCANSAHVAIGTWRVFSLLTPAENFEIAVFQTLTSSFQGRNFLGRPKQDMCIRI